jgi:hypothetical protein
MLFILCMAGVDGVGIPTVRLIDSQII